MARVPNRGSVFLNLIIHMGTNLGLAKGGPYFGMVRFVRRPDTGSLCNICTTSAQRLRRWSNIVQMSCKCFVLAGIQIYR